MRVVVVWVAFKLFYCAGHGPWSHLWEKYLHSVDSGKDWSHEDMSERLLEAAVKETVEECSLPAGHFLCCPANLAAVKAMIRGDSSAVEAPKKWLYSIVCNDRSGEFLRTLQRCPQLWCVCGVSGSTLQPETYNAAESSRTVV